MHPTAAKVQERLRELGVDVTVRVLPGSTRTAVEAAAACGCELGQIVKSLVFVAADEEPVICLWAGDRQVPAGELGLRRASADEVRDATGFAVGGVPPLGHDRALRTIVDESLAGSSASGARPGRPTRSSRSRPSRSSGRWARRETPGGILATLADGAMGYAFAAGL